jgi:signal transduction histidine kinase
MMASITYGKRQEQGWFESIMDGWRHVIQVSERTLIDNVAATVPWLAPVSPAYMVWHNAVNLLGWPVWVAWVVAGAVEGLGLSVVSTAFSLWKTRSAAFWVAVATTFFYLAIIITVNVALELGAPVWIAKALLSLLSVPAAVTIALRSQQAQAVEDIRGAQVQRVEERIKEEERAQRLKIEEEQRAYQRQVDAEERERRYQLKLLKAQEKVTESFQQQSESFQQVSPRYGDWRKVPQVEREKIAKMTTAEIMESYGTSERTAINWRSAAQEGK